MSRTYVKVVDADGEVENVGEAPNASSFYVSVWTYMLKKYRLADESRLPTLNLKVLGRLWSRVAKIDRDDGLVVAATFDRCWFPRDEKLLRRLFDALHAVNRAGGSTGAWHVANCVNHIDWRDGDRGVAFGSSLNDAWACRENDGWHVVSRNGHKCKLCDKRIQHAIHMLDDMECCREDEESTYAEQ